MIEINVTQEVIDYVKEKLESLCVSGEVGMSKFGSEKNRIIVGYIGEKVVMDYLGIEKDSDEYDYDLVSKKGKKLEVKTVSCKFKPRLDYLCTVNSHDLNEVHKQEADYYVFVRILNDYTKAWILGYKACDQFFEEGTFVEKGKDFGTFKFVKANATVMPIDKLNKFMATS